MKDKLGIFLLLMIMLFVGCKTTAPGSASVCRIMVLQIQNNGDTYDKVMDVIHRQTHIRSFNVTDVIAFHEYYQQMEVEIDFLSTRQVSSLQTELFRIPGVITVNFF